MSYEAKIIADSLAPNGKRLTTFQVTFPRIILAEMNTHRAFSRNSASSRAIPVEKMIEKVETDPFIPIYWGRNQRGMQANAELTGDEKAWAISSWLGARDEAVSRASLFAQRGVHKQITNRLLEPFLWHSSIITATEYANFFAQRCHPDAQPEMRRIAEMMRDLYDTQAPTKLGVGDWHLPYIVLEDERDWNFGGKSLIHILRRVSTARCARVSYLTQEGKRDINEDLGLYDRLVQGMHWSPFEHVAEAIPSSWRCGNFWGWQQFRQYFPNENRTEYPHAD